MKIAELCSLAFQVFMVGLLLISGCSDNSDKSKKIRSVKGVAKTVDIQNRKVSMTFTDDKGVQRELTGTFLDETVVIINGRNQGIEDIHEGDKVIVFGYSQGEGVNQKLIATKVVVDRPQSSDWKSTGLGKSEDTSRSNDKSN